jgi:hypothetical protein
VERSRRQATPRDRYDLRQSPNTWISTMSDAPPDRLCADPRSRFFNADMLDRGIGVRFDGVERTDVEEYCVSEGWVRVPVGRALDRRGRPMCLKRNGTVQVWFLDEQPPA